MSNAKHTPGPWHTGIGKAGRIIYAADGFAVADATVFHGRHQGDGPSTTEVENARLIAAAPELLAALEAITNESVCLKAAIVEQARAAITKAKGEEAPATDDRVNLSMGNLYGADLRTPGIKR